MTKLNDIKRFSVYFPSEYNQSIIDLSHLLSDIFQGASRHCIEGTWKDQSGQYIDEAITVIYALYEGNIKQETIQPVFDRLLQLKSECKQESIMVENDKEVYFL